MQARIENLELGIRLSEEKLSYEVSRRQEELLEQASSLRDAEGAVQVMHRTAGASSNPFATPYWASL